NQASFTQLFERFPNTIIAHLFHTDIVKLQEVDPIRFEPFQGRLSGAHYRLRREILRNLTLAAPFVPVMDKIVSNLCRYHNLIPLVQKSLGDQLSAQAVPVCVGCLVECYSEIEGFPHQIDGLLLSEAAPPSCRYSPHAKSNLAHGKIGISISAIFHCVSTHYLA